jgi:hypothetical protein
MKHLTLLVLALLTINVSAQYKKENKNIPLGVAFAPLPTSFAITEINTNHFERNYGYGGSYFKNGKEVSYSDMVRQNSDIILTGALVTAGTLLVRHLIANKRSRRSGKSCFSHY